MSVFCSPATRPPTPRTINAIISLMAAGLMVAQINRHRFPAPAVLPGPYSASVQDELPITPAGSASRCGTGAAASPCRQLGGMLQPDRLAKQHVASPVSYTHLTLPTNREV